MSEHTPSVTDRMVLNTIQHQAVVYSDGPELVFAGAGTGKTRVLTAKIAYLISNGYRAENIFAATFTNKAAGEMRARVEAFLNMPATGLWIGTFHSLCARILRREASAINYTPYFTIYDSSDQVSLMKKVLKQHDMDDRSMPPKLLLSVISKYKSSCISASELEKRAQNFRDRETAKIYTAYQRSLFENGAMDFDDLITNTVYMFQENDLIRKRYRERFRYILVDEYQDTNMAQFRLIHLLAKEHNRVFAVGDDDQSIYGWRGARIDNILSFENHFPETKTFTLEQNYRSTKSILEFANAAISPNINRAVKNLWTDRQGGASVIITRLRDDRQEAERVASGIKEMLNKMKGTEIAVLFRTNAQSRIFEEVFRKKKIPYLLVGGTGFYERAEIKDCLAFLRLLINPGDNISFERIVNNPPRGLGDKARSELSAIASEKGKSLLETLLYCDTTSLGPRASKGIGQLKEIFLLLMEVKNSGESPDTLLREALQLSGYIDMLSSQDSEESLGRIENVNELMNALAYWAQDNPGKGLSDFLEEVTLASDVDIWNPQDNAVNLMTLHCAKGLEFRSIFFVGIEDGIIPSRQNFDDESKVEEERRLFYVGSTRAMEYLECSYVDQRRRFGEILPSEPTRFLLDIPKELFHFNDCTFDFGPVFSGNGERSKHVSSRTSQSLSVAQRYRKREFVAQEYDEGSQIEVQFRMGQSVNHKSYGRGKILGISGFGEEMKLTVLFGDGVRRKLMAKFANFQND